MFAYKRADDMQIYECVHLTVGQTRFVLAGGRITVTQLKALNAKCLKAKWQRKWPSRRIATGATGLRVSSINGVSFWPLTLRNGAGVPFGPGSPPDLS